MSVKRRKGFPYRPERRGRQRRYAPRKVSRAASEAGIGRYRLRHAEQVCKYAFGDLRSSSSTRKTGTRGVPARRFGHFVGGDKVPRSAERNHPHSSPPAPRPADPTQKKGRPFRPPLKSSYSQIRSSRSASHRTSGRSSRSSQRSAARGSRRRTSSGYTCAPCLRYAHAQRAERSAWV